MAPKVPVRRTKKGAIVDLESPYMYPDGHCNLFLKDDKHQYPFNNHDELIEGLVILIHELQMTANEPLVESVASLRWRK